MLQTAVRVTLAIAGAIAAIILTTNYYEESVECLARMEKLAHAAVPTLLATVLLYHVLQSCKKVRVP